MAKDLSAIRESLIAMWNFYGKHQRYFSTDVGKSLVFKFGKHVDYILID